MVDRVELTGPERAAGEEKGCAKNKEGKRTLMTSSIGLYSSSLLGANNANLSAQKKRVSLAQFQFAKREQTKRKAKNAPLAGVARSFSRILQLDDGDLAACPF